VAGIFYVVVCVVTTILLVVSVACIILLERKLLALSQRRVGPAILGRRGILQIVADVIKPLFKDIFEQKIQTVTLAAFSIFLLFLTQLIFAELFQYGIGIALYSDIEFIIFIQTILSGFACFSVLLIGYLSGSKYAMIGSVRLAVSELSNDTSVFIANSVIFYNSVGFDYEAIVCAQSGSSNIGLLAVIYSVAHIFHVFIAAQRSPLDLIEVEGELVAGYNTEYSGPDVLVIYFSEYFHLFNGAVQFILLILGGIAMDLSVFNSLTTGYDLLQNIAKIKKLFDI
jgi:NADH:ubiquinone oxidoreductase subunit H